MRYLELVVRGYEEPFIVAIPENVEHLIVVDQRPSRITRFKMWLKRSEWEA